MPAGDAERRPGHRDARPWYVAIRDRIAQGDVLEVGGADVAHGRESRHQGAFGMHHAADYRAVRREEVIIEVIAVDVARKVCVHVHQAGQHERSRQVDHLRAFGNSAFAFLHRNDALALDNDHRVLRDPAAGRIEQTARLDVTPLRGGRLLGSKGVEAGGQQQHCAQHRE